MQARERNSLNNLSYPVPNAKEKEIKLLLFLSRFWVNRTTKGNQEHLISRVQVGSSPLPFPFFSRVLVRHDGRM